MCLILYIRSTIKCSVMRNRFSLTILIVIEGYYTKVTNLSYH